MNQEAFEDAVANWEEPGSEVVRTIDTDEESISRITKYKDKYYLRRYFTMHQPTPYGSYIGVSVDLNGVDADTVIQHLGEQL
jgi:hypothetical protein